MLAGLSQSIDPNLLVGFNTSDDAAVYRLTDEIALVTTADFITPPVDDPVVFGQVAAANALSDVYAMGGKPLTCLNLVGFPSDKLGPEILRGIIEGALQKITEAGAVLAGGHSTEDEEPKFGLSVVGTVHPKKYWSNAGARPGDVLVLTKPVGSGVLFNANQKGWVSAAAMEECLSIITTLNKTAAEVLAGFEVHAATDITGFGLAGHSLEMARGSGVTIRIELDAVPVMRESLQMYKRGMTTGVNKANWAQVAKYLRMESTLPEWHREIVIDPQTSGGLMASIPAEQGDAVVAALREAGVGAATLIGRVETKGDAQLIVV